MTQHLGCLHFYINTKWEQHCNHQGAQDKELRAFPKRCSLRCNSELRASVPCKHFLNNKMLSGLHLGWHYLSGSGGDSLVRHPVILPFMPGKLCQPHTTSPAEHLQCPRKQGFLPEASSPFRWREAGREKPHCLGFCG